MRITSALRPPAFTPRPVARASRQANLDSVQLSGRQPSKLKRAATNLVRNTVLGALPALGTCVALALGGPNAAGLALAGGMGAAGLYAAATLEGNPLKTFAAGGFFGLISGAAGMIGPPGVGLMALGGAVREGLKWGLDLAENGSIEASL